ESPDEGLVAELVIRVVSDVLRHITIKNLKGGDIRCVPSAKARHGLSARNVNVFPKGYSSEFPVLFPQITLEDFGGGEKTQNGGVAFCDLVFIAKRFGSRTDERSA